MATTEIYRVHRSPWSYARTCGLVLWAFASGYGLALIQSNPVDHRDWQLSTQTTHVSQSEDIAKGTRTVTQDQTGLTESRTTPTGANPYDAFSLSGSNEPK
jgi:hypothetical protein